MAGAFSMSDTMVKISSRALLQLLSGGMNSEEFLKIHPWPVNPFKLALDDGRLIDQVAIHSGGELDDDWIEFKFGSPDAASTPFR
jgi:hypothetical protein